MLVRFRIFKKFRIRIYEKNAPLSDDMALMDVSLHHSKNGQFIHSVIKRYDSRKCCSSDVENFMHRQSGCFFRLMKLPLQNLGERNFVGISFVLLVISRVCCVSGWPLVPCFGITLSSLPLPSSFHLKLVGTFLLIVTVCSFKPCNCLLLNHQISLNLIQLVIQRNSTLWLEFGSFAVQIRSMKYYILKEGIVFCRPGKYLDIDVCLYPYTFLCPAVTQLRAFVCRFSGGVTALASVVLIKSCGLSQYTAWTTYSIKGK